MSVPFPPTPATVSWTTRLGDSRDSRPGDDANIYVTVSYIGDTGDGTPPTATAVTLASDNTNPALATEGDTITLSLTFDEDVVAPSVTIQGQTAQVTGAGTSWTASLTVGATTPEGNVTFEVSGIEDTAGNTAAPVTSTTDTSAVSVDRTGPALSITGVPASFQPGDVFNVSFNFGEAVSGFDASDVVITGATAGPLTGGLDVYTMTLTADGTGNISVSVPDGAAQDGAGNPSTAATVTAALDSVPVASEMIADFMETRARNLIANQPGLTRFLNGQDGGQFNAQVTRGFGDIDIHTGAGPVWFSLSGSATEFDDGGDSAYALATLGGHVEVSDGLIVGGMLQFDHAEDDMGGGVETRGTGWLIGPYVVAQLGDQPLFFEGRLLYGESDNEVSPFGTFTDDFESERWLTMLAIEGSYETEVLRYFPRLQLSHAVDTQLAYVDGLANLVPEQTVRLSEVSAGVDFEAPLFGEDSGHLLTWGLSGIWSRVEGDGAASAYIDDSEGGRARLDLGYRFMGDAGLMLSGDLFVDGIGSGDFMTYGAEIGLSMEF
ncbi:hypothetical protein KUV65_00475 [Maritalea mobilis]|uniref:Ig-like domain-containing protein n=1 Tax=Maritalea mobilis TaxID=483324 RepID=UPI001C98C92D|nr:Ig-like domain-containing protein [Maritalea mobilis]MBY6199822.1 hypothetical protein [Maritalea mobilis]